MGRDWDKELAKIDRQIAGMSDDELARGTPPAAPPGAAPAAASPRVAAAPHAVESAGDKPWAVYFRVGLAVALAVSVPFWPYASRCGVGLWGYLGAVLVMAAAGVWGSIASWRARIGRVHVLSLTVLAWGLSLAAVEILPRIGYATDATRSEWVCR